MRLAFLLVLGSVLSIQAFGQKPYLTSDGELILGFATINQNGVEEQSIPRFTMFFHGQSLVHFDQNKNFGFLQDLPFATWGLSMMRTSISVKNTARIMPASPSVSKSGIWMRCMSMVDMNWRCPSTTRRRLLSMKKRKINSTCGSAIVRPRFIMPCLAVCAFHMA